MANAREATLHRVNAIKAGIITESTKSELVRLEAEPARLQQAVHGPFKNGSAKQLLTDLKGGFRNIVGNLASLASRNIEKTRGGNKGPARVRLHSIRVPMAGSAISRRKSVETIRAYCGWQARKINVVEGTHYPTYLGPQFGCRCG